VELSVLKSMQNTYAYPRETIGADLADNEVLLRQVFASAMDDRKCTQTGVKKTPT